MGLYLESFNHTTQFANFSNETGLALAKDGVDPSTLDAELSAKTSLSPFSKLIWKTLNIISKYDKLKIVLADHTKKSDTSENATLLQRFDDFTLNEATALPLSQLEKMHEIAEISRSTEAIALTTVLDQEIEEKHESVVVYEESLAKVTAAYNALTALTVLISANVGEHRILLPALGVLTAEMAARLAAFQANHMNKEIRHANIYPAVVNKFTQIFTSRRMPQEMATEMVKSSDELLMVYNIIREIYARAGIVSGALTGALINEIISESNGETTLMVVGVIGLIKIIDAVYKKVTVDFNEWFREANTEVQREGVYALKDPDDYLTHVKKIKLLTRYMTEKIYNANLVSGRYTTLLPWLTQLVQGVQQQGSMTPLVVTNTIGEAQRAKQQGDVRLGQAMHTLDTRHRMYDRHIQTIDSIETARRQIKPGSMAETLQEAHDEQFKYSENGSLTVKKFVDRAGVLRDANEMTLAPTAINMIVGKTGSGKTSLIHSIIRYAQERGMQYSYETVEEVNADNSMGLNIALKITAGKADELKKFVQRNILTVSGQGRNESRYLPSPKYIPQDPPDILTDHLSSAELLREYSKEEIVRAQNVLIEKIEQNKDESIWKEWKAGYKLVQTNKPSAEDAIIDWYIRQYLKINLGVDTTVPVNTIFTNTGEVTECRPNNILRNNCSAGEANRVKIALAMTNPENEIYILDEVATSFLDDLTKRKALRYIVDRYFMGGTNPKRKLIIATNDESIVSQALNDSAVSRLRVNVSQINPLVVINRSLQDFVQRKEEEAKLAEIDEFKILEKIAKIEQLLTLKISAVDAEAYVAEIIRQTSDLPPHSLYEHIGDRVFSLLNQLRSKAIALSPYLSDMMYELLVMQFSVVAYNCGAKSPPFAKAIEFYEEMARPKAENYYSYDELSDEQPVFENQLVG